MAKEILFINSPPELNLSGNPIIYKISSNNYFDNQNKIRAFYRLSVDVYKNGSLIGTIADISIDNTDNTAEFDISEFTNNERLGHFTFPEPNSAMIIHKLYDVFYIRVTEQFGVPIMDGMFKDSAEIKVLNGKLPDFKLAELNTLNKSFLDLAIEKNGFLTNLPTSKFTDIYSPEKLYFLCLNDSTLTIVFDEKYDTGNNVITESSNITAQKFDIIEIFASYHKVKTDFNRTLISYSIYIKSNNERISEIRNFKLDYNYHPFARYFYYQNMFGVYDILRCTGKINVVKDIKKQKVKLCYSRFITIDTKIEKQYKDINQTSYECSTGYMMPKEIKYLNDFFESTDVYILKNGTYLSVNIDDLKHKSNFDIKIPVNIDFKYADSFGSDFESGEPLLPPVVLGDFNMDFNSDYFIDNEQPQSQATATPTFSPSDNDFANSIEVTISGLTPSAQIRYTTDGSTPTIMSPLYTAPITITSDVIIKAIAMANGLTNSSIVTKQYHKMLKLAPPTIENQKDQGDGTYWKIIGLLEKLVLTSSDGAIIKYTTDGTTPNINSLTYVNPIQLINTTTTVKAFCVSAGYQNSEITTTIVEYIEDSYLRTTYDEIKALTKGIALNEDNKFVVNVAYFTHIQIYLTKYLDSSEISEALIRGKTYQLTVDYEKISGPDLMHHHIYYIDRSIIIETINTTGTIVKRFLAADQDLEPYNLIFRFVANYGAVKLRINYIKLEVIE